MINQNTKISSALTALAVVCVTAFTGTLAHAQLEEIVVPAQKAASLQDTNIYNRLTQPLLRRRVFST